MVYLSNNKVTWKPENTLYELLISSTICITFSANAIGINNYTEKIIQRFRLKKNWQFTSLIRENSVIRGLS